MSENLVEKYATKTYIDKDYKDIVVSEKSFVNLVQENKKQKEVIDKIKEYINRTEINSVGKPLAYTEIGKELLELLEEIE